MLAKDFKSHPRGLKSYAKLKGKKPNDPGGRQMNNTPQDPLQGFKDIILELAKKLAPILAFPVLVIIVVALLGDRIPPDFRNLINIVVISGMVIYAAQAAYKVYLETRPQLSKPEPQPPPSIPEPSPSPKELPPPPVAPPTTPTDARQQYLSSVIGKCRALRLVGIDPSASHPGRGQLSLEKMYISLDTTAAAEEKDVRGRAERPGGEKARSLSALEALAQSPTRRAVLLGLPGTGKSTFVRYLALQMARAASDRTLSLTELLPGWPGGLVLPVVISLGRLAESLPAGVRSGQARMIEDYLRASLNNSSAGSETGSSTGSEQEGSPATFAPHILDVLQSEGGLVLFDGLDEVADLNLRPVVRQAVEDFVELYSHNPASRFLVTCRTYSYQDAKWQLTGWPTYELALLSPQKIEQFVNAWYAEHTRIDPAQRANFEDKRQKLLNNLQSEHRRHLAEIAPYAIILTMMAVVHTHYGELPDSRAQVYARCTELLLEHWESERMVDGKIQKSSLLDALQLSSSGKLYDALYEIAYKAHEGRVKQDVTRSGAAEVTEDLLSGVLCTYLEDLQKVQIFLDYCRSSNGLLMWQGTVTFPHAPPSAPPRRVYAFPHLTFEEYLAGQYLLSDPQLGPCVRRLIDQSPDRWREVVMLMGEHLCFDRKSDQRAMDEILEALAPRSLPARLTPADGQALWLAGDLLTIYFRRFRRSELTETQAQTENRILDGLRRVAGEAPLPPRERAAAANTLDELGWSPPDLYRLIPIPDDQAPQFLMAKYPVTNAQYARFLQAEDFADPQLWRGFPKFDEHSRPMQRGWGEDGWKWLQGEWDENHKKMPRFWNDLRFGLTRPGAPVVGITWWEANAFCRWLLKHWDEAGGAPWKAANPSLRPGEIRLPTEAEWVAAAGGAQPRERFPWDAPGQVTGDKDEIALRANTEASGIGRTTPVWLYPQGASQPYGLMDLAGNTWEWQANFYNKDHDYLALRGGSWLTHQDRARLSSRNLSRPVSVWYDYGFRLVSLPMRV
jgi:formylglycine-generating enzyme required for sulfatase activity